MLKSSCAHFLLSLLLLVISPSNSLAKIASDSFRAHTDFPYLRHHEKILLDFYYSSKHSFKGTITISIIRVLNDSDSILVLRKESKQAKIKKGVNKIKLNISTGDAETYCHPKFFEVLARTNNIAPGHYKIYIAVEDTAKTYNVTYYREVDSMLTATSPLRKDINGSLQQQQKKSIFRKTVKIKPPSARAVLKKSGNKVGKTVKKNGLTSIEYEKDGKQNVDLYYEDWFAGRYQLNSDEPLSDQLQRQEQKVNNINSSVGNGMESPSLFSQYKSLNKEKSDQEEAKGEIGSTTYLSTGQEQHSGMDNNYEELRGRVGVPIMNIPVQFEGLYTTQDRNRKVKTSYFRVHYDNNNAINRLKQSISGYNAKFTESKSKALGLGSLYHASIGNMEGQKTQLLKEIGGNKGSVAMNTEEVEAKKKKIEEIDMKISKYRQLLDQAENSRYFDSSLVYSRTNKLPSKDYLSYKQLHKRSEHLMPDDGKAKGFISGITSFDAGMFPKNSSRFTMNGQMIRGLDGGYDLGMCEAGATVGKTEYIGRDGNLDKYTCYAAATNLKAADRHTVGLIYYGYTPDKKLTSKDAFFKNRSISTPSFFNPVHIVATTYDGVFFDNVSITGEVATSINHRDQNDSAPPGKSKMAYHLEGTGNIPGTFLSLNASYDKVGIEFENNTLPFSLVGTEQYKAGGRSDFFRSILTVGVEYNYLVQRNFSVAGSSTKWGFDMKTNFKRYPNVFMSYKPFTTFRSYSDTFSIPQRPLFGSVWTGKMSYNLKRHADFYRFAILYSRNSSVMDTAISGNELLQALAGYTGKRSSTCINVGQTTLFGTNIGDTIVNPVRFLSITATYNVSKQLSLTGDKNFGMTTFGFCRYAVMGGFTYRPETIPVSFRISFRYNTYLLRANDPWKKIYSGMIDLTYRFKVKNANRG